MSKKEFTFSRSSLAWLRPDKNPFYLITFACIFTLTYSADKKIFDQKWDFLFYLVGFILLINLALSLVPQKIEKEDHDNGLRFARAIGIMVATLSLVFLDDALESQSPSVTWLFISIIIQVLIFSIYLFITTKKDGTPADSQKRKINNFQLCLITSALLMGIVVNFNYSAKQTKAAGDNKTVVVSEATNVEPLNDSKVEPPSQEPNFSEIEVKNDPPLNNAMIGSLEQEPNFSEIELKKDHNISGSINNDNRHGSVVTMLFIFWIICIIAWIYQLRGVINIRMNPSNDLD